MKRQRGGDHSRPLGSKSRRKEIKVDEAVTRDTLCSVLEFSVQDFEDLQTAAELLHTIGGRTFRDGCIRQLFLA